MGPLTKLVFRRRVVNWPVTQINGRYAIYPHWIFGRGVLIDEERKVQWENHERKSLELVLWAILACMLAVWIVGVIDPLLVPSLNVFLFFAICLVVFGPMYAWYAIASGKILVGVERTLPRPAFRDHIEQVAKRVSWPRAIFGILTIVIVNALSAYLFALHAESWGWLRVIGLAICQVLGVIGLSIQAWVFCSKFGMGARP